MIFNIGIRHEAISVQANLLPQVKPRSGGRSQNACNSDMSSSIMIMARSILIMAGGTGGHIFSSDVTRQKRALVCTENMARAEVLYG